VWGWSPAVIHLNTMKNVTDLRGMKRKPVKDRKIDTLAKRLNAFITNAITLTPKEVMKLSDKQIRAYENYKGR
jgi:hypothetical protein